MLTIQAQATQWNRLLEQLPLQQEDPSTAQILGRAPLWGVMRCRGVGVGGVPMVYGIVYNCCNA